MNSGDRFSDRQSEILLRKYIGECLDSLLREYTVTTSGVIRIL